MFWLAAIRAPGFFPDGLNAALFEAHPAWWILLSGVGAAGLFTGRARGQRRLTMGGWSVLAAVLVWILAAWAVVTPGERLYAAHLRLAAAAKAYDFDKIAELLTDDFSIAGLPEREGGTAIQHGTPSREELEELIKSSGVRDSIFTSYHVNLHGDHAYTDVTVITQTDVGPIKTNWTLTWEDSDDWRLRYAAYKPEAGSMTGG